MVAQKRIVAIAPIVSVLQPMVCHNRIYATLKVDHRLRQIFQLLEPPAVPPPWERHMDMSAALLPRRNVEFAVNAMPYLPLRLDPVTCIIAIAGWVDRRDKLEVQLPGLPISSFGPVVCGCPLCIVYNIWTIRHLA